MIQDIDLGYIISAHYMQIEIQAIFLFAYSVYADKQLSSYALYVDNKLSACTLYADKANQLSGLV